MKILLIIDQFDNANNGTTISAKRFAEVLKRHGNEVRVVSTGAQGEDKYAVKEIPLPPIANQIVKNQGMAFARPERATLEEAIAWADVVHFLLPLFLSMKGLKIAQEQKVPHTAAFHMQPENITYTLKMGRSNYINNAIYHFLRDHFYNSFTHIHCPSNFIASQLREHGYTAQLHVISNGVDGDFVYRKLPKPPQLQGKFVILMIGRLSNEKRQDVLIDAVKRSRHAADIQLVLAGKGPNLNKYRRLSADLHNPIQIGFYNKQQLMDLIASSDLYVHAADAEIEAISCIEAFSSGLVPIISNSPKSATPQFALDQRSLFESGNSVDLADKIDYWIEHPQERSEMEHVYSERGKNYNIDTCVSQIEEMFRLAIEEMHHESSSKHANE